MEKTVERIITELVYLGFFVLFVMNFTALNNGERFGILVIVELTFVGTKVYCKAKSEGNKKFYKKGDKRNEKKD